MITHRKLQLIQQQQKLYNIQKKNSSFHLSSNFLKNKIYSKCDIGKQTSPEMQLPVHWNRHGLLIKIPSAQQVCTRKVGGIKPPRSLEGKTLFKEHKSYFGVSIKMFDSVVLRQIPG